MLPDALRRSGIAKQVDSSLLITHATELVRALLPPGRDGDAQALSLRDGALTIGCLNTSVANLVMDRAAELQEQLVERHPTSGVRRIHTRIVPRFEV